MSVNPRRPGGPPLTAMRAFEAAARHQSYVAAAAELSVTPGAISQHVKTLEGWAGVDLFHRKAQGLALSPAGRSLVDSFTEAFDALSNATQELRNLRPDADIHIAALPSIAQLWLPPRLGKLRQRFSNLKFSVTALETPPNLMRELFDVSLFFGIPDGSADQVVVAQDRILPVCAPFLVEQGLTDPRAMTLIHDQTWKDDWAVWSRKTGMQIEDPTTGPNYSLYSLAVEEAKSGAGALMGHVVLIQDALNQRALMALSDKEVETGRSLLLNLPRLARRRAGIKEIVDLLVDHDDQIAPVRQYRVADNIMDSE
ncbi:MAG: LysR family transcriptional regulator [Pseudomonadota bacterium]